MYSIVDVTDDNRGTLKLSEGSLFYAIDNGETLKVWYDDYLKREALADSIAEESGGSISDLVSATRTLVSFTGAGKDEGRTIAVNVNKITLQSDGSNTKIFIRNISNSPSHFVVEGAVDTVKATINAKVDNAYADITAPTVDSGTLIAENITASSFLVNYALATDNTSGELTYSLYTSTSDNISDVADAEANGTLQDSGTDTDQLSVEGLTAGTQYYFNVIVEDRSGNKTAYTSNNATTTA